MLPLALKWEPWFCVTPQVSLRGRQRRESFERRISRPHFHVKPLDDDQLSAWSQYLDFELSQVTTYLIGCGLVYALGLYTRATVMDP